MPHPKPGTFVTLLEYLLNEGARQASVLVVHVEQPAITMRTHH